jgi:hypothetical protein
MGGFEPAAAAGGKLIIAWPQARLAVNTPDKLELGMGEVSAGLKSHLMLIMDWYGVGREDALQIAEQISRDNAELQAVNPEMAAARALPPGERERYDDRQAQQEQQQQENDE